MFKEPAMITEHEIPILEYDDSSPEVIAPDHDWTAGALPEKCLFAFLGNVVHEHAAAHGAQVVHTFVTVTFDIPVYVLRVTPGVVRTVHDVELLGRQVAYLLGVELVQPSDIQTLRRTRLFSMLMS